MRDQALENPQRPRLEFEKRTPRRVMSPTERDEFNTELARRLAPIHRLIEREERNIRVPLERRQKPFTV